MSLLSVDSLASLASLLSVDPFDRSASKNSSGHIGELSSSLQDFISSMNLSRELSWACQGKGNFPVDSIDLQEILNLHRLLIDRYDPAAEILANLSIEIEGCHRIAHSLIIVVQRFAKSSLEEKERMKRISLIHSFQPWNSFFQPPSVFWNRRLLAATHRSFNEWVRSLSSWGSI
jgi:hypothetical protein